MSNAPTPARTPSRWRPSGPVLALALVAAGGSGCGPPPDSREGAGRAADGAEAAERAPADLTAATARAGAPAAPTSWSMEPAPPAGPLPHPAGVVFGHLALPAPARSLASAGRFSGDSELSSLLRAEGVRALMQLLLQVPAAVAHGVVLEDPAACVLVDFKIHAQPYVCSFAYRGGPEAFARDLDVDGLRGDPRGHLARIRVGDQLLYVDGLADDPARVVISFEAGLFASTRDYLADQVLARTDSMRGDFELVLYPRDVLAKYAERIDDLVDEALAEIAATDPDADASAVELAWRAHNREVARAWVDELGRAEQVSVHLGFEAERSTLELAWLRAPVLGERPPALAAAPTTREALVDLPSATAAVAAFVIDAEALADARESSLRVALGRTWAALSGQDEAAITHALAAALADAHRRYTGHHQLALIVEEGTLPSLLWIREKRAGDAAEPAGASEGRAAWQEFSRDLTPTSALGPELAQLISWHFETLPEAPGRPPIDRWVLEPTPALRARLQARAHDRPASKLLTTLAAARIFLDRVESTDRVTYLLVPEGAATSIVDLLSPPAASSARPTLAPSADQVREPGAWVAVDLDGVARLRGLADADTGAAAGARRGVGLAFRREATGSLAMAMAIDREAVVHFTRPTSPAPAHP